MTYLSAPEQVILIVFIILTVILVLLVAFFVSFPFIVHAYRKKHFVNSYGRKVYKIANVNDYYLINRLLLKTMDGTHIDIDHLLCGNKYIYVINDSYIEGELFAKMNDKAWVIKTKKKDEEKQCKIDNLLLVNKRRLTYFSQITNISPSLLINIVLINDNLNITGYEQINKSAYLVQLSSLSKLINSLEKDNVAKIKDNQLKRAIIDIAKLNERRKNETKDL